MMKKTALGYALNLIQIRDRTEKEIKDKLLSKSYEEVEIEKTIQFLLQKKFIDDKRFVKRYLENASLNIKKGRRKVIFDLKKRGISTELIYDIEKDYHQKDYNQNEYQKAKALALKWLLKNINKQNLYQKLGSHLSRAGYDTDLVIKVLDEVLNKNTNI